MAGQVILFPNVMKVIFGNENIVILLGIGGIFGGISSIMGPILSLFILDTSGDSKDKNDSSSYLLIYLLGAAPTIISLIVSIFIKPEYLKKTNRNQKVAVNTISYEELDSSMKQ